MRQTIQKLQFLRPHLWRICSWKVRASGAEGRSHSKLQNVINDGSFSSKAIEIQASFRKRNLADCCRAESRPLSSLTFRSKRKQKSVVKSTVLESGLERILARVLETVKEMIRKVLINISSIAIPLY